MENSRELQVRTIDGQSVKVRLTTEETVQHLKLHLQQLKWPLSSETPLQYHLFLRGGKLDASTQLRTLPLGDGEFLVLIPYTTKNKKKRDLKSHQMEKEEDNENSKCRNLNGASEHLPKDEVMKPTDVTWHAILADFTTVEAVFKDSNKGIVYGEEMDLRNRGNSTGSEELETLGQVPNDRSTVSGPGETAEVEIPGKASLKHDSIATGASKPRRHSPDNPGFSVLPNDDFGKRSLELPKKATKAAQSVSRKSKTPALPPALGKLSRVFHSLNSICGFLQKQHMQPTWQTVKQSLQQFSCPEGESVTVQDIHFLAVMCPRLVVLSNMTGEGEDSSFYIDLFDPSTLKKKEQLGSTNVVIATNIEQIGPSDWMPSQGAKPVAEHVIRNVVGRREKAFQKALAELLEYLQKIGKCTSDGASDATIDDFMAAAKSLMNEEDKHETLKAALPRPPRGHKKLVRCTSVENLGALEMMEHLKNGLGSLGQFVHCEPIKRRKAAYGELQKPLTSWTTAAVKQMGITRLYTHQAEAINAVTSGLSTIVATSTASGKSLCYNIPVLDELYRNENSCALYLFPTKALAQDQLRALQQMSGNTQINSRMGVYDGDTPQDQRVALRDSARLIISNPDMLHVTIMPSHHQFARILSNLRFVVLDEAHAYRGVFGCHTALILRRLRRLCHFVYGNEPTFIVCSATVANPSGHAQELLGLRKIQVVQNDGSPCGDKFFVLWNPPLVFAPPGKKKKDRYSVNWDGERAPGMIMKRTSPIVEVATLLAEMVQHGLRCIAFCKSRKLCELVYNYTQEILKETAPELVATVRSYRGGYSASERRIIETDLFGGKLRGVAATNALELGVDVGSLDATLHLGFPGTVASLWQQSGRAGRREKPSLSVYVAFGGPLDQHFMKHPSRVFSRPIENAQVDAQNQQVLEQHLACAAVEYPLHAEHDKNYFGSGLQTAITQLVHKGRLGRHPGNNPQDVSWNYIGEEKCPSQAVSIRAIDPERYKIVDMKTNEIIEEVEECMAFYQVYQGAVYMNQGKTYLVKSLDLGTKVASCQEADLKYYTATRDFTDVHVTGGELAYPRNISENMYPSTTAMASTCKVTTHWLGFNRFWKGTNERFDSVELFLPDVTYDSQAAWIRLPPQIRMGLAAAGLCYRSGLHAANHALLNVMPLYIMCNPADLGTECANPHDTRYMPERLLVYDRHPGGIGIAAQARPMFSELLQAASELLASCECTTDDGCPCCVQTLNCGEYNEVINKQAAVVIIQKAIESEEFYRKTKAPDPAPADGFLKPHSSGENDKKP